MGADAETRIYTNHRKPLAGDAKGRMDSAGREEETLQTQTLRANAISRPACSDRCEGRTPTLYCRPAAKAVSVHRHRRVFPLSRSGRSVPRKRSGRDSGNSMLPVLSSPWRIPLWWAGCSHFYLTTVGFSFSCLLLPMYCTSTGLTFFEV